MASGITKYYQFARCFRDEDLRADRQPEFTQVSTMPCTIKPSLIVDQLDMEMSFASEEDVMNETENLLSELWYKVLKQKTPEKFQRMKYQTVMARYGSDKPDLRYKSKVC